MKPLCRIDRDRTGRISEDELADWVNAKAVEHYSEAREENQIKFNSFDINEDGLIEWDEFLEAYFTIRGYDRCSFMFENKD